LLIREAAEGDLDAVLDVERRAFGGNAEAELVRRLLSDPSAEPRLSLLAIEDGRAVGHILFTAVKLHGATKPVTASILAPMAVIPERQGRGIGGALIRDGLKRLKEAGTDLVFVLGWPDYYPRHGFEPAGRHGLDAPYPIAPENADAWMVRALRGGVLGAVTGTVVCADALDKEEYWVE
jgi:putative acetyltransferase